MYGRHKIFGVVIKCGFWVRWRRLVGERLLYGLNAALIPSGVQIFSSFLLNPRMYGRHKIFGVVIKCGFWVRWRRLVGERLLYQVCGKTIDYIWRCLQDVGVQAVWIQGHRCGGPCHTYIWALQWWFFDGGVCGRGCSGQYEWVCSRCWCLVWFHSRWPVHPGRLAGCLSLPQRWIWCWDIDYWGVHDRGVVLSVHVAGGWRRHWHSVTTGVGIEGLSAEHVPLGVPRTIGQWLVKGKPMAAPSVYLKWFPQTESRWNVGTVLWDQSVEVPGCWSTCKGVISNQLFFHYPECCVHRYLGEETGKVEADQPVLWLNLNVLDSVHKGSRILHCMCGVNSQGGWEIRPAPWQTCRTVTQQLTQLFSWEFHPCAPKGGHTSAGGI